MKRILAAIACVVLAGLARGDEYRWLGGDGKWNDAKNWYDETSGEEGVGYPQNVTDIAKVSSTTGGTIQVSGTIRVLRLTIEGAADETAGAAIPVTLTGAGTLNLAGRTADYKLADNADLSLQVGSFRHVDCQMGRVNAYGTSRVAADAVVTASDGTLGVALLELAGARATLQVESDGTVEPAADAGANKIRLLAADAQLIVAGGSVRGVPDFQRGIFDMRAGSFTCARGFSADAVCAAATDVKFTGGTVVWSDTVTLTHPGLLAPSEGTTLIVPHTAGEAAVNIFTATATNVEINGTVFITNGLAVPLAAFYATNSFTLGGAGTLVANRLALAAAERMTARIELPLFVLGSVLSAAAEDSCVEFVRTTTVGAFSNWASDSDLAIFHPTKALTFQTADWANLYTPRQFSISRFVWDEGFRMNVRGTGTVELNLQNAASNAMDAVTLEDTATLALRGAARGLRAKTVRCARNSSLSVTAGFTPTPMFSLEADFRSFPKSIALVSPTGENLAFPVFYPHTPLREQATDLVPLVSFSDGFGVNWFLKNINGCVTLYNGTPRTASSLNSWTGEESGSIRAGANWSGAAMPACSATAVYRFDGIVRTAVTNDWTQGNFTAAQFVFAPTAGPFLFSEGSFHFASAEVGGSSAAVVAQGEFPIVFDCPVYSDSGTFGVWANPARAYVAFAGGLTDVETLDVCGDVRLGGTTTCGSVHFTGNTGAARGNQLLVSAGGSLTVTNQVAAFDDGTATLGVDAGGTLTVSGGSFGWSVPQVKPTQVDGTLDIGVPLGGTADLRFTGSGRLNLADTGANVTDPFAIRLEGEVSVFASKWCRFHPLVIVGQPTLGATCDWTYGAEVGDIRLEDAESELIVDTEDPSEGTGHEVTIAAPIVGAGRLVKRGAGTLTLGASAAGIAGGVHVEGGLLGWTVEQHFASLTFDAGAGLLVGASSSGVQPLTLDASVDVTGLRLDFAAGALVKLRGQWQTVVMVPADCAIEGTPVFGSDRYETRQVETASGRALQVRMREGFYLMYR